MFLLRILSARFVLVALLLLTVIIAAACGMPSDPGVEPPVSEAFSFASGPSYAGQVTYSSTTTGATSSGTFQAPTGSISCNNGWSSGLLGTAATLTVTPTSDPTVVAFTRTPAPAQDHSGRGYYPMTCSGWARVVHNADVSGLPQAWMLPYAGSPATQAAAGLVPGDGADAWVAQARSPDGTALSYCHDQWATYLLGQTGTVSTYQWIDTIINGRPFLFGSVLPNTVQVVESGSGWENQNSGAVPCSTSWVGSLALPAGFNRGTP